MMCLLITMDRMESKDSVHCNAILVNSNVMKEAIIQAITNVS